MFRRLALALVAPLASTLGAQQPERSSFYMLRGADTVVVERSTRTVARLDGEFVAQSGGTKVTYGAALTLAALVTSFQSSFSLGGASAPAASATVAFVGDSVIAQTAGPIPAYSRRGGRASIRQSVAGAGRTGTHPCQGHWGTGGDDSALLPRRRSNDPRHRELARR